MVEVEIIDAERGIVQVTYTLKRRYAKEQLLRIKANLEKQLAEIMELLAKCP
jgi:hypothetical protein